MNLDYWWSGLRVAEKERIAAKIVQNKPDLNMETSYPYCTDIWNSLSESRKEWIYSHCKFKHGSLDKIEFEGEPLTD